MITLQITLFDKENRYKPISTLIAVESVRYYNEHVKEIKEKGIIKICQKRGWTARELKKYNYLTCKVRVFNKIETTKERKDK